MRISDWSSDVCSSDLLDDFYIDQRHDQFSQELRIASPSGQRITYVAGLYYFARTSDDLEILQPRADAAFLIKPGQKGDVTIASRLDDKSYAAFAHVDFNLTDRLTLSAGGRYTREDQDRSEEHTSELQSLIRSSYAVFCLNK